MVFHFELFTLIIESTFYYTNNSRNTPKEIGGQLLAEIVLTIYGLNNLVRTVRFESNEFCFSGKHYPKAFNSKAGPSYLLAIGFCCYL